jgi:hypothetical protein
VNFKVGVQETIARIGNSIALIGFCITKEILNRMKRQFIQWEKTFASYSSGMVFISRIYTESKKINTKITSEWNR